MGNTLTVAERLPQSHFHALFLPLSISLCLSLSLPHYLSSQPDYIWLCCYLSLSLSPPSSSTLFFAAHRQVENNLSLLELVEAIRTARGFMRPLHLEDLGGSIFSHVLQRCQAPSHLHSRGDEPFTDMLTHHCNLTSTLIKGVNWSHFLPALKELEEESHIRSLLPQYSFPSPQLHCIGLSTSNSRFVLQKQNNTEH